MFFLLAFMLLGFGLAIAGMYSFLPLEMIWTFPSGTGMIFFMFGAIVSFLGLFMLYIRAKKVGADHLIAPGRPDKLLWFYVTNDDVVKIVPSIRDVEGYLYSKKLDAEVQQLKSYRLFDHAVVFVPEGVGHCADLKACLYAYFLKTKYGFKSIKEARSADDRTSTVGVYNE